VLPKELPGLTAVHIDLDGAASTQDISSGVLSEVLREPDSRGLIAVRGGMSYVRSVKPVDVQPGPTLFRRRGTYIITGGLGGVALSLARELALRFSASFVLMSRSPFPPPTEWSRILGEQPDSEVARRIRGIRAIEELGSRVSIETLDVTDPTSTEEVLKRIVAQRGSVSGVFHAAGVLDDGPGLTKERAHARRVLEPKVEGSLNVVHAAQQSGCPFVVLFGSTSAHLAPAGQVDYVAANNFLDSTAHALDSPTCRVFAVDWGIWRNLGMTATHADAPDAKPEQHLEHHLFYGVSSTEDSRAYHIRFDTTTDWYINEHRLVDGRALMPGTLVLEMVRAAFELETGLNRARISGLVFQLPIFVPDDESVEARLTLTPEEDGYHFAVVSVTNEGTVEHASGSIAPEAEHVPVVPPQISSPKLPANEIPFGSGSNQRKYLDFGPRWNCLHELTFGSREAEAELLLPKTYAAEAQYFGLHPALMDVATGCALGLSEAYLQEPGLCVPISYGHVRILGAVPAHCRSYVQLHGDGSARGGILSFDAVVSDMSGRPLVVIEDFLMKLVDEADLGVVERPYDRDHATGITNLTELGARFGIEAQEGASILELLLTESGHPHRIVSSLPWATIVSVLQMQEAPAVLRRETDVAPAVPRDEVEQALAGLWQSLLGAGEVGIYDDFFDLGGHSLIAVRLFSKIRSMYGVDMSLATLFEAPTVAAVAVLVRAQLGLPGVEAGGDGMATTSVPSPLPAESGRVATAWSPLVEIRATGTHAPFFCVHGAGGNVLNFRDLAHLLPTTRPFYGLQARGVDGRLRQHTRIEDMAAEYVAAIRKVQPSGPYLVGGYSGGGVVALEMAQQLRANGEETSLVVLFDTFHPHLPPRPGLSRADKLKSHVRNTFSGGAGYIGETLANRGKHVAFQWRNMRLRLRQKLGLKLPLGLREIVTVDGFLHAAARYAVRPYDGDVALFAATDRSHIYSHVSLGLEWERDLPRLRILKIPGNHDNLVRKPNVGKLADLLERELKRASPSPARHNPATQSIPAPTAGSSRVGADWSPLVEIRSSGSNTPFFCVHGAGGNVLNFRDLAHLIPTERPFYGLQSRGTAKLLQEHTRIEEMAAEYLEVIRKVQPVGPYLLGGYSGGGIIALEMAQQLRAANENAARVVFIDTFHPRLPPRPRYAKHSTDLRSVREFMVYYLGETLVNRAKRLRFRWHTGQLVLRNRLGLPLPLTLRQKVTVDTFLQAAERYAVRPYDGDVTLFVATDRSGIYSHLSPGLEWERDLPHLRIIKVPGNHGNLVKRPNVGTLADLLERELTRAPTTPTRPERATPSRSTVSRP
jgi:thioesterase domain-containing protein/NAD(P)-dependent dehydrogenase (short-subunit alcohol dehydrogenase family)/acyl carrier protein